MSAPTNVKTFDAEAMYEQLDRLAKIVAVIFVRMEIQEYTITGDDIAAAMRVLNGGGLVTEIHDDYITLRLLSKEDHQLLSMPTGAAQ